MKCENCIKEHDGSYGSGRFCSSKCARGFSTKAKRKEIGQKISKKLKERAHNDVEKTCPKCQKIFNVHWNKRHQKFCSISCSAQGRFTDELKEHLSLTLSKIRSEGHFKFNSVKNNFIFKNKKIRCDSLLENRALQGIVEQFNEKINDIKRSGIFIDYFFEGNKKYFNPDFLIILDDKKILLECKTKISKRKTNKGVRKLYFETVEEKKKAMKKYCSMNNLQYCWFNEKYEWS